MASTDTPQASDDRELAERKSRSVDERVPDRGESGQDPAIVIPGAFGTNLPQGGLGAAPPLDGDQPGPGESALEIERKALRTPIQRG